MRIVDRLAVLAVLVLVGLGMFFSLGVLMIKELFEQAVSYIRGVQ